MDPKEALQLPAPMPEQGMPPAAETGASRPEQAAAPERGVQAGPPAPMPASIPLPTPPPMPTVTQPVDPAGHQDTPAQASDDSDLIEKEWVSKAKQIVERTRHDPYKQSEELTVFKADYMKKRYNRTIKLK